MNRFHFRVSAILLVNIIPAFVFAGESNSGPDMNTYGLWAGYLFFVIITLFFIYFLYSSSHEQIPAKSKSPALAVFVMSIQNRAILAPLKFVNYSVISIIFLYIIIFILLIT